MKFGRATGISRWSSFLLADTSPRNGGVKSGSYGCVGSQRTP